MTRPASSPAASAGRLLVRALAYVREGRWTTRRIRDVTVVEWFARAGYGARGVVHLMMGALAIMAAYEAREDAVGIQGAFEEFARWPLGELWLSLLATGLGGFVLWRFAQSVLDADRQGRSRRAWFNRTGQGVSAVVYTALALSCLGVAAGIEEAGENPEVTRQQIADLLALPLGELLLILLGCAVLAAGLLNMVHAVFGGFRRHLTCDYTVHLWAAPLGRAGYFARGLVFLALGVFLVEAALDLSPAESVTIQGALKTIEQQPFGSHVLTGLGAGLIAFGLFGLIEARFRRIVVPKELRTG